jgi:hypothetical protein
MEWEVFVDAAQTSNKMVFEGADGTFGGVAAVYARWCELEVNVLLAQELFERFRTFVIKPLEAGAEAGNA